MNYKTIIILAKYPQAHGVRILGRELYLDHKKNVLGDWIRLISPVDVFDGAIFDEHCYAISVKNLNIFDVILVPIKHALPRKSQPDNWLINDADTLMVKGQLPANITNIFLDQPKRLWQVNGRESHLLHKSDPLVNQISQSVYFIKPKNLVFYLGHSSTEGSQLHSQKVTASFVYNNEKYQLPVLDPKIFKMLNKQFPNIEEKDKPVCLFKQDNYYLLVSLDPLLETEGYCKSVVGVFDFDGYLQTHYK